MPRRSESRRSARSSTRYQTLVPLLRGTREKAGISQVELARRLGKPQSWVAKIESGERRIDPAELILFARAVGVDPVRLFKSIQVKVEPKT